MLPHTTLIGNDLAHQIAAIWMIFSDIQCHFLTARHSKCVIFRTRAAVDNISTDIQRRAVPKRRRFV